MLKQDAAEATAYWCYLPVGLAGFAWLLGMLPFLHMPAFLIFILAMWLAYLAIGIAIGTSIIGMMRSDKYVATTALIAAIVNWLLVNGIHGALQAL